MNQQTKCRAAFAQTDITPDFEVEMIGAGRPDNRPTGVHCPLLAQALLFEREGQRFCLIAIDNLGLTTALSDDLRAQVAQALGTTPVHVMLSFTHTHSAPAPLSPIGGARYFALLCQWVVACAIEAAAQLDDCLISWAMGETHIGDNRRDGCTVVDRRLAGLRVVRAADQVPIALLLRASAHANVLMRKSSRLSSDYIGLARIQMAQQLGCPAMVIQGASGNIKPNGVEKRGGGDEADAERVAGMLAADASALAFPGPVPITRLAMEEVAMDMFSDVPDEAEAQRIVQAAGTKAEGWLVECARLRGMGFTRQTLESRIHFLCINEGCIAGVADEIFCEIALEAQARAGTPMLMLNGYTDGCTGYLPHREEWLKGGYETFDSYLTYYPFHGHVMPFQVDTAQRLVDAVVAAWKRMESEA